MTALPADDLAPTAAAPTAPALRRVPRHEARMRGLVTPRDLVAAYDADRQSVRKILAREGAPRPVAESAEPYRNVREPLYRASDVDRFIHSLQGTDGVLGQRRRSAPVRRVGTSIPSGGRLYAWRDPARLRPARRSGPTNAASPR